MTLYANMSIQVLGRKKDNLHIKCILSEKHILKKIWLWISNLYTNPLPLNIAIAFKKNQSPKVVFLLEYCSETSINFPVQKNWEYLRENNDNKIQPVPRVTKEGEFSHAKASCKDFYEWFKSIYSSKSVSKENNRLKC